MKLPAHLSALIGLRKAGVDFLMIGALALDHFVPEAAAVYTTADCDILLRPSLANLLRAFRSMGRSGYALKAGGEPLVGIDDLIIRRILEHKISVRAEKEGGMPVDMLVEAKGFRFEQWWAGRTSFRAGSSRIPCGSLAHVLESKRQAGRPKDKLLIKLFEISEPAPRRKPRTP